MSTIKHNQYNHAGEIIGTFDMPVKPSNETETDIYITDEFLRNTAKRMSKNSTSGSNYSSYEKAVWYKPDHGDMVRIKRMECKKRGEKLDVTFTRLDGKKIEKTL